jgi:NAD(P)-dependent dehydrogenase (short-subunit alcohol dehydrogenase family)
VEADIIAVVRHAVDEFGQLDVMFNNAGVGGAFGALVDLDAEDWNYTYSVLVNGVFLGTKHAARQMIDQESGGAIINTGSVAGVLGGAGPLCYSTAKAAVNHFTRCAAAELAPHRIRVNAILPGPIRTPLMLGRSPEVVAANMAEFVPGGEIGEPEHIAAAALFLASHDAAFVNGETLTVDGGMSAAAPGITLRHALEEPPPGVSGVQRGTTGQPPVIRRRR